MSLLSEILKLDAEIARLSIKRDNLRSKYVSENCPYKAGQRIRMKPSYGQEENGIIVFVRFSSSSPFLKGMAYINVRPCKNDWSEKERRHNVNIHKESEILKVY